MALSFASKYGREKVAKVTEEEVVVTGGKFHPASGGQNEFVLLPDPFGRVTTLKDGRETPNAIYSTVANAYFAHMAKFAKPKHEDESPADWHDEIAKASGPIAIRELVAQMKRECIIDRKGWDKARQGVLVAALTARVTNAMTVRQLLLATGDAKLVYQSERDLEFASDNFLGSCLEQVRAQVREQAAKRRQEREAATR